MPAKSKNSTNPALSAGGGSQPKAGLRRAAEARRRHQPKRQRSTAGEKPSAADATRLLHQLEVHQIELEMQNQELAEAKEKLEALVTKYTDLYDFAPVGYFSLDAEGSIRSLNLAGANLLGADRARLVDRRFGDFIAVEARPAFTAFLRQAFSSRTKKTCEISIQPAGKSLHWVWIEAGGDATRQECRLAVMDITGRKLAEADRTRLERQVFAASEREQRRIGESLQEDICQRLTGMGMTFTAMAQALRAKARSEAALAKAMARELQKTYEQTLQFARTLQPVPLLNQGLVAALEHLLQHIQARSGVPCLLQVEDLPEIAAADATHLYRIVQEALDNSARHAKASRINLSVAKRDHDITLTIADDGVGMAEPTKPGSGLGLPIMRYRSDLLGAALAFETKPGRGTVVRCSYPLAGKARR